MKLEKVNIKSKEDHATMSGGAHYHVFTHNETGEELIERTTAEAHAMQKIPGGSFFNPKKEGYTWQQTFGTNEYNTPDGNLGEGQYAEEGAVAFFRPVKGKEFEVYTIPKTKITNNEIADNEVAKLKAEVIGLKLKII